MQGERLDKALGKQLANYSRSFLQDLIKQGLVTIAGKTVTNRTRVVGGELVELNIPDQTNEEWEAEDISIDLVYEDEELLVLNKPAGLVVHPGAGNPAGTLLNALLYHSADQAKLPRAGIVHRLDKETSGLMVVARTEAARQRLIDAIQLRKVSRQYQVIVQGRVLSGGTVDAPIGRHRTNRVKMAVTHSGKPAVSHYRLLKLLGIYSLLQVNLESGRTHQIRVHMAHIGHPVVGDPVYGGRARLPTGITDAARKQLVGFSRQALHACKLEFRHPFSGQELSFGAEPPADFAELLKLLTSLVSDE